MKNALAAAYGGIIVLFISIVHDELFTKTLHWPESAALVGAVAVGVLLLVLYELIGDSRAVARRFSPVAKIEGTWMIAMTNNDARPMSVCKIYFAHTCHVYRGYGINCDGTLGSEWSSRDVHYDERQDELSFTSDSTLMEDGRRVRNYGYIKFYKNANGKFDYGNGYFVDMADKLSQTHMTLTRMSDSEFDQAVKICFAKTKSVGTAVAQQLVSAEAATQIQPLN